MFSFSMIVDAYKETILFLGVFNIIVALFFLIWPNAFVKLNDILKRWIHTERIEEALNRNRDIDSHVFKARKAIGYFSVVLAVVLFFLYFKV